MAQEHFAGSRINFIDTRSRSSGMHFAMRRYERLPSNGARRTTSPGTKISSDAELLRELTVTMHVGEALLTALVQVGKPRVVEPEQA